MNWNDNVNTQDGRKVKLADFIKTGSGASDLVEIFKSPRLVKLTCHYEGVSSTEESFDFKASDYGIDTSINWCMYCMCFALDSTGNTSFTPVLLGKFGNDHPSGHSLCNDGECDVEMSNSGVITVFYQTNSDSFTSVDVEVLIFVMGGE